jgi:hypothetical protein
MKCQARGNWYNSSLLAPEPRHQIGVEGFRKTVPGFAPARSLHSLHSEFEWADQR